MSHTRPTETNVIATPNAMQNKQQNLGKYNSAAPWNSSNMSNKMGQSNTSIQVAAAGHNTQNNSRFREQAASTSSWGGTAFMSTAWGKTPQQDVNMQVLDL
jgi:hypothetical protein